MVHGSPNAVARGDRKKMSAEKLVALGRTLPAKDRMQQTTVNKHATNLAEYWSYLVTQPASRCVQTLQIHTLTSDPAAS